MLSIPQSTVDGKECPAWIPRWAGVGTAAEHQLKPVIRCKCGQLCGMNNHGITYEGEVFASWFDQAGCGFHEFLKLEGWDGGRREPGDDASQR